MSQFLWKIGGEAGFGIMTVGLSFSKLAARSGYNIYDYAEYPSLIRGGHNTYEVNISLEEVFSTKNDVDLLVCLNKDTFNFHKERLNKKSIIIYDPEDFDIKENFVKVELPFKKLLKDNNAPQVMANTMALSASIALLGGEIEDLYQLIEREFGKKGEKVVDFNKKFVELGFNHIKNNYVKVIKPVLKKRKSENKYVFSGNEAFAIGAVAADCKLYVAYPMTPASNALSILADWQAKSGIIVRHAEDEIAVINTALGASFAGARAATGTSGGGFALMVEALSYAGVAELPIVVLLGQRPGPATGMPTWTEQGDLLFAVHSGHGEFPKIILSPGDMAEMVDLTVKAFDYADIYQVPVIIMSEKLLLESHQSEFQSKIDKLVKNIKTNRGKMITQFNNGKYLRYKLSEDGISERLLPGTAGQFYQANSYEHSEDSHTTEDSIVRKQQVEKRNKKIQTYFANHFQPPQIYGNLNKAEKILVSWGSNKGPILEAMKTLKDNGINVAYIHFTHLYPLEREKIIPVLNKDKKYILIENNSSGQLGKLLMQECGIEIKDKILKYDGRPFWPEEIVEKIKNIIVIPASEQESSVFLDPASSAG